jgi:hypothetical protein
MSYDEALLEQVPQATKAQLQVSISIAKIVLKYGLRNKNN